MSEQSVAGPPVNLAQSAWNPRGFTWMGLFFSFLAPLILAAYNWERLGHPEKKRPLLIAASLSLPIVLIIILVVGESPYSRFVGRVAHPSGGFLSSPRSGRPTCWGGIRLVVGTL